jgi:hypothetical protein
MELLRQAVKAGWNNVVHIREDADFTWLRSREDFHKLVEELKPREHK